MSKRILVEGEGKGRQIAVMDGQKLLWLNEAPAGEIEAEQIYLGVVDRIVKGMEAAFVRLGGEKTGFLPFSECKKAPRSGEKVLVQVKKPPVGDKAPYLTQDVALAGRYVILTPLSAHCAVSKKITEENTRQRLLAAAQRLCPENMGLVMRTESEDAKMEDMEEDAGRLLLEWKSIAEKSRCPAPCLIQGREDALLRILRDEHGDVEEILTNAPQALPPLPLPVREAAQPFELYGVRAKAEKAMQRKVWLDCGGYLIIDRTEALTVIDVNSGKFTGAKSGTEDTFLKLNLEAARETARLMRLRNMGGIIIVDFVDMKNEESRQAVAEALADALRGDPVKTVVHGFTALGLMELTRKKS